MRLPPQTIMAAIDFSVFTDTILSCGVMLCKKYGAQLLLVHVTIDANTLLENNETTLDVDALQQENTRYAEEALEELIKGRDMQCEYIVSKGDPADEISRLAAEQKADAVITATHGRSGVKRLLIGSVTEKLLKTLTCSMLVLHASEQEPSPPGGLEMNKILVGCDFSQNSEHALDYGLSLALEFRTELHLCHVIKPSFYKPELQESKTLQERLENQLRSLVPEECRDGCVAKTVLLDGEPYNELVNYAEKQGIDLIVVGIRGHTLWEKLLVGSTTDRLIRHTPIAVLAVRQM